MTEISSSQAAIPDLSGLDGDLSGTSDMAASFGQELSRMRRELSGAGRDVAALERSLGSGLNRALRATIVSGDSLSTSLRRIADTMINSTLTAAIKPVSEQVGSVLGQAIAGLGGFAQGQVMPFANGGVVTRPVQFPMRGGTGLMGEAGPEAIMPLSRGPDGKLGVRAQSGGAPVHVVMNITTPDAESFRRSQGQIAARMSRVMGQGARNR